MIRVTQINEALKWLRRMDCTLSDCHVTAEFKKRWKIYGICRIFCGTVPSLVKQKLNVCLIYKRLSVYDVARLIISVSVQQLFTLFSFRGVASNQIKIVISVTDVSDEIPYVTFLHRVDTPP